MDHVLLDTQSQNVLDPGEAGFYTLSSQRPQSLHLFLFALNLQSFPVTLEFGLYQKASLAIQLCESGDQLGWMEDYFHDFQHKTILVSSRLLSVTICKGYKPYPSSASAESLPTNSSSLVELGWGLR